MISSNNLSSLKASSEAFKNFSKSLAGAASHRMTKTENGESQLPDSVLRAQILVKEYKNLRYRLQQVESNLKDLKRGENFNVVSQNTMGAIITFTPNDEFIYNYCKAVIESEIDDLIDQLKRFDKPLHKI